MTCENCADKGLIKANFADAPTGHYAVCLCPAGRAWRKADNMGTPCEPQWVVWAHAHQVPLDHIWLIEDIVSPEELDERGLSVEPPAASPENREAALLALGKKKRLHS
jgi:hypothetical protein